MTGPRSSSRAPHPPSAARSRPTCRNTMRAIPAKRSCGSTSAPRPWSSPPPKCHFYHFRWNGNAEIRLKAMLIAMKEANALGNKVYIIGQNYSWGHDVQKLTRDYAKEYGYTIVGDVIHDVNKIQDFAPYVAKIKEAGPGHGGHGQLVQRPPAAHEGRGRLRASRHAFSPTGSTSRATSPTPATRRWGTTTLSTLLSRRQRRGDRPRSPRTSRPRRASIR